MRQKDSNQSCPDVILLLLLNHLLSEYYTSYLCVHLKTPN